MGETLLQITLSFLAMVAAGAGIGWLVRGVYGNRHREMLDDDWQQKVDDLVRQRDRLTVEVGRLRSSIEKQQAIVHQHESASAKARTELQSAQEKAKSLSKDVFTLRAEREDFKTKVSTFQNALTSVKQRSTELEQEFIKSGKFYKGELLKSFEKRKVLETKLENAKLEQESFDNLLNASRSEHESVNKILASAQIRLANLDALEQNVIELEAENAQLGHDNRRSRQEIEALQRDVAELEELRVQNRELAHCLKSMEDSRAQYENDAKRYRDQAGHSEQKSETLRLRLDEVEQHFAEMEAQQRDALRNARKEAAARADEQETATKVVDDLQQIVGIGKAFESALNEIGVYSYQQIAAFDVSDVARVNLRLGEFRGRMEQDDWIGQAKELQFKKYG